MEKLAGQVKILVSDALVLIKAAPAIAADYKEGKSLLQTVRDVAPEALPILEGIANLIAPGSGIVLEILAKGLFASHRMTPAEEKIWFDRQTASGG